MKLTKWLKVISCCTALIAPNAMAGFFTYADNWPNDADIVNEKVETQEASTAATPTKEPCAKDVKFWSDMGPDRVSECNRLYAKFGATFFNAEVRKISNTSITPLAGAYVLNNSAQDNYVSWEFGLGTRLKILRWELEYMYEKNITYNASPVFLNLPENLTSTVKNQSVWLNALWDADCLKLPYFTPYLGASAGFVWNKTTTQLTGGVGTGVSHNDNRMGVGWGVTIGARIAFWTRWFGYIGYKYIDQYTPRWKDSTGIFGLKGHYVINGVDLGVMYLLG